MPFKVEKLETIYQMNPGGPTAMDRFPKASNVQLENWLNRQESEGYSLVGLVPDHHRWNATNRADDFAALVILHKD